MFICGVFAVIFAVWCYGANVLYQKAVKSESWRKTTGVVTEWEMRVIKASRGSGEEVFYCRYRYQAEGREYVGDTIRISPHDNKVRHHSEYGNHLNERYRVGANCDVWYNPDDPAEAILEPGTATWTPMERWLRYSGVVSVVLVGLIAWGLGRKRRASMPESQE
jgi:hypothetical protein